MAMMTIMEEKDKVLVLGRRGIVGNGEQEV